MLLLGTASLTQAATEELEEIARSQEWRALLHASSNAVFSSPQSLVDSSEFFLSPDGTSDLLAELRANLSHYSSEDEAVAKKYRCSFPARSQFISTRVLREDANLSDCEQLNSWLAQFSQARLTLVFAGSYLGNPASVFGHTFLRIDSQVPESRLLQQTISYGANATDPPGPLFAIKGLTGRYFAQYRLSPYFLHLREYNDIEDRELLEFPLAYSEAEVRTILLHLWELQLARFEYFFIDENCSYNLLTLLEVARPQLTLTGYFPFHVVPLDVVRILLTEVGLRGKVGFREAPSVSIRQRYSDLPSAQQENVVSIARAQGVEQNSATPETLSAEALDILIDYFQYLSESPTELSSTQKNLLIRRSVFGPRSSSPLRELSEYQLPHSSSRLSVGQGSGREGGFTSLGFRFLYHDTNDAALTYPLGSELEFLKFDLHFETSDSRLKLEEFLLLSFKAAPLFEPLLRSPSWDLSVATKRRSFAKGVTSLVTEADARLGLTRNVSQGIRFAVLLGGSVQHTTRFTDSLAVSADAILRLRIATVRNSALELEALGRSYVSGIAESNFDLELTHPLFATDTLRLLFSLSRRQDFTAPYSTVEVRLRKYF